MQRREHFARDRDRFVEAPEAPQRVRLVQQRVLRVRVRAVAGSIVAPDERSAASGVTAIARSIGASISPALTGWLIGIPALFSAPFFLSGGLKIIYDLLLYREFRSLRPPEENP